jgi:hypothetical protein
MPFQVASRVRSAASKQVLLLGEDLLDRRSKPEAPPSGGRWSGVRRFEIWAVGRQEEQVNSGGADSLPHRGAFVTG